MRLFRLRTVWRSVLIPFGMFALGVLVVPAAAQAANEPTRAPQWSYEGKVLAENETREVTAKIPAGNLRLETTNEKIKTTCTEGKLKKGAFLANQKEEAVSEFSPEFSNCKVEGNGEKCTKVHEPIEIKPVRAEFVLNDLEPEVGRHEPGNKILVEFDPRAGSEFVELKAEGEGCKFANTVVKNLVLALVWTDKTVSGEEKEIELGEKTPSGGLREEISYILKSPDEPESVYLWSLTNKKFELFKPTNLVIFSTEKGRVTGELLILTAEGGVSNNKKFGLVG